MIKRLSFALFDTGETILGALVFSTFFPLFITKHVDVKLYSFLYGASFLISFVLALHLGKLADRRALRKNLFTFFGVLTSLLCFGVGLSLSFPLIALLVFLVLAVSHQQTIVFYNSLLLNFEEKGFTSGLGVAFGYVGSAFALIFLAKLLKEPEVYFFVALIFFLLLLPAVLNLRNPVQRSEVSIKRILRDRRFLLLMISVLSITEVANTLIAMMGVYLRGVYGMESMEIYRVIGLSALGGVLGGFFWGVLSDRLGVKRVFPVGFLLWIAFLILLTFLPKSLILPAGFLAGFSLSHVWTISRVLILKEFSEGEASIRLSFLSLTERVASTTGLFVWSLFLLITGDNFRLSAGLMAIFPLVGLLVYLRLTKM